MHLKLLLFKISKNRVPVMERPSREAMEQEKKEFEGLFVNVSDEESDTEMFDFNPTPKVDFKFLVSPFWLAFF